MAEACYICSWKEKTFIFLNIHTYYILVLKDKNQLDATYYFIVLMIGSTCFGHCYAHHQELTTTNADYHIGRFVLGLL